jgi:hypothetical protein
MSALTRKDKIEMLGELDDVVAADIIATGAASQELAEAHQWLTNDEAFINAGRYLASGLGRDHGRQTAGRGTARRGSRPVTG